MECGHYEKHLELRGPKEFLCSRQMTDLDDLHLRGSVSGTGTPGMCVHFVVPDSKASGINIRAA